MRVVTIVACSLVLAASLHGEAVTYHELELQDGEALTYALVLPESFDPEKPYPALLALPAGRQDRAMVEDGLTRYWGQAAAERDWIVVSPVAPGWTFFQGAEIYLPELIEHIRDRYPIERGRFHLAGVSMGGNCAFTLALEHPEHFLSLTVLPGYSRRADPEALKRLADIPIRLFGGANDGDWIARMRETEQSLKAVGADVVLRVFEGEGHSVTSLEGSRLMEMLDGLEARPGDP